MWSKVLTNKWFWIGLITLIILLYIYKNWDSIKQRFKKRDIDFQPNESPSISDSRKLQIKQITSNLNGDIYNTPILGHTTDIWKSVSDLTDNELLFSSQYYRKLTNGVGMIKDIRGEYCFIGSDVCKYRDSIVTRLNKIGEGF